MNEYAVCKLAAVLASTVTVEFAVKNCDFLRFVKREDPCSKPVMEMSARERDGVLKWQATAYDPIIGSSGSLLQIKGRCFAKQSPSLHHIKKTGLNRLFCKHGFDRSNDLLQGCITAKLYKMRLVCFANSTLSRDLEMPETGRGRCCGRTGREGALLQKGRAAGGAAAGGPGQEGALLPEDRAGGGAAAGGSGRRWRCCRRSGLKTREGAVTAARAECRRHPQIK
ncbi:uncharacterized protein LOC122553274 [Chiloscyllium plagiosum]|uniref:uncharacterized protein LOC122553274 n=1 Tax=Chiloscyllium plagiosum TaxID=36176 RepID=UPI001CB8456A|nr:uncharacterized protein LOC122553274 [Chiloscyllium plagiosum]